MSIVCEYCNTCFKTLSYLNVHKKTAKYCLKIQNNDNQSNNDNLKCEICMKFFAKKYFKNHLEKICYKNVYEINTFIKKLKEEQERTNKNKDLELKNEELKSYIQTLEKENNILNGVNSVLKSDHECLQDIAKQPKNVVNTNNKILNILSPMDFTSKDILKNKIEDNYKLDYIFSGQKGIAKFAFEHILKDEEGNLKYVCTDHSRQIFKYKDETGEVRKDVEAKKLTNFLVEGGIKDKACDIMNEWWTEETGIKNTDKFELLVDKAESLRIIDSDNNEFKKELATMTTI